MAINKKNNASKKLLQRDRAERSTVGEKLEELISKSGKSIKKIANETGIAVSVLHSWVGKGNSNPTDLIGLARVVDYLDGDFREICTGQKAPPKKIEDLPITDIFEESEVPLDGIYQIKIVKLTRKKTKTISE